MNIVIVTPYYYPLYVPRAIRAAELAAEFARRGHGVTVINLTSTTSDEAQPAPPAGVQVVNAGLMVYDLNAASGGRRNPAVRLLKHPLISKPLFYLTLNRGLMLQRNIAKRLTFSAETDMVISIGLPFAVHWGVAKALRQSNFRGTAVADYGDPFSAGNPQMRVAPYFRALERHVLKSFDYVTIPVNAARQAFASLKSEDRLKVIPQGFDMSNVSIKPYRPNKVVTFAFAGRVYADIRDPRPLLEYLRNRQADFRFILYVDTNDSEVLNLIQPYTQLLGKRLVIHSLIPRSSLIEELSEVDFLINIENISATQSPSKLVDYALTQRPILSFSSKTFDAARFEAFCRADYTGALAVDVAPYDIKTVASQFLQLATNSRRQ